ncbi:DUF3189 family protein [Thermovenabulum sp.]|uniref:DUF3189 family protein n=1 Tax=Thermovenabulum sp. TaxID=3100335 RepID=UPI003C7B91D2
MKVIYADYWGSYISVVAASIHLGLIIEYDYDKLLNLQKFCDKNCLEQGRLIFFGTDKKGRKVYILGVKKSGKIVERALRGISEIYDIGKDNLSFVDLSNYKNIYIKAGEFFCKKMNFKSIGQKLIVYGIKKNFIELKKLILKIRE